MNLTINQIMLLLDIYRGTNTQARIGTRSADKDILFRIGYLDRGNNITEWGSKEIVKMKNAMAIIKSV